MIGLISFFGRFKITLILMGVSLLVGFMGGWASKTYTASLFERSSLREAHRASEELFKDDDRAVSILKRDIEEVERNAENNDSQCFDTIDIDEFNSL